MRVRVASTNGQYFAEVEVENVTDEQYTRIISNLRTRLATKKNFEAIAETYQEAVASCPDANPSDLWRHLVYRPYLEINGDQSWKRAGGQALEVFFADFYNPLFSAYGIKLIVLARASATLADLAPDQWTERKDIVH